MTTTYPLTSSVAAAADLSSSATAQSQIVGYGWQAWAVVADVPDFNPPVMPFDGDEDLSDLDMVASRYVGDTLAMTGALGAIPITEDIADLD